MKEQAQTLQRDLLDAGKAKEEAEERTKEAQEAERKIRTDLRSAMLGHMCPMLEECMSEADDMKSYFADLQSKDAEIKIKLQHQNEIRVISCPGNCATFERLARLASERFQLPNIPDNGLAFKYEDSEGDMITVSSTDELKLAIGQFPSSSPKLHLWLGESASANQGMQQAGAEAHDAGGSGGGAQGE